MAPARFRPLRLPVTLLAVALLLAACAGTGASSTPSRSAVAAASAATPTVTTTATPTATPAAVSYPLTLTDDAGRSITLPAAPQRIVSLAPSNTEIVCAVGACDRLTGVTDFDDYPASVTTVPKVVVNATVDIEKVVAARPDLVLAAGNGVTPDAVISQLRGLGLRVLTLSPSDLAGVKADIELVGRAVDRVASAAVVVGQMQARVAAVQAAVTGLSRPRTFYEVSVYQGVIYTAGAGSFLASLIDRAGGDPVTGDAASTAITLEQLITDDPQLILLGDASYDAALSDPAKALSAVRARSGWEVISAVRDGRVVPYLDDIVTTRPGPRIVDGLEALARAIHPEAFAP